MSKAAETLRKHGWEQQNIFVSRGRMWSRGIFHCILDYGGHVRRYDYHRAPRHVRVKNRDCCGCS